MNGRIYSLSSQLVKKNIFFLSKMSDLSCELAGSCLVSQHTSKWSTLTIIPIYDNWLSVVSIRVNLSTSTIYQMWSKNNCYFKFRELRIFRYVGTHVCSTYVCWQYQPFWIVTLFWSDIKVSRVLVCSWNFYYSETWIKETILSFL